MDGIELDIGAAENLLRSRTWQYHVKADLGCEVIEFHVGVVFRCGTENTVGGVDGQAVDEAKSNTCELAEGTAVKSTRPMTGRQPKQPSPPPKIAWLVVLS
jgi:hypothetical protein